MVVGRVVSTTFAAGRVGTPGAVVSGLLVAEPVLGPVVAVSVWPLGAVAVVVWPVGAGVAATGAASSSRKNPRSAPT